ncbi:hypothetical protein JVU11DRAFT_11324 [Chiua virens]|nr:hypothetical protein JVU11DRAFT_11324 [Chiua virens]
MGPPQDRDVVMGPPPPPLPPTQPSAPQSAKDNQDVTEKYRKLKRRYFELEEKYQDTQTELRLSGERNVKLREERDLILQRIHELETRSESNTPGLPSPPSSAFPRSLLSARGRAAFVSNLRQAITEDDAEDHAVDPLLNSRYLGPLARKRADEEHREQLEDEARQGRKQTKRSRQTAKGKEPVVPPPPSQPILTLAPVPQHALESGTPPLLVSNKGARLRLKPPVKPSTDSDPGSSVNHRPPSPLSPVITPPGEHPYQSGLYPPNGVPPSISAPPPANSPSLPGQSPMMTASPATSTSRPSEIQRHAKPKRLKAHTVTSKSYSIPTVPRDKKNRPLLPLIVGIMTVVNLGEVCMREHFHTERYIFPVGYEVTRRYHSTVDPQSEAVYHCSILDGGDGPKFQIVASDVPDRPMIAGTATGAWSSIVKQANAIRHRQHSNSVSGPDFFGLGQNTIKHLIQELPNADRLRDYVWQHFVEGGPLGGRYAAVIPALPEDHDPNAPNDGFVDDTMTAHYTHPPPPPPPHIQSQSFTTILLPPPAQADTLSIHEYRPPPAKEFDSKRQNTSNTNCSISHPSNTRSHAHTNSTSSPNLNPSGSPLPNHANSSTPIPPPQQPPYVNASAAPAVPATFASIMNAYPPQPSGREDSQVQSRPGSREELARRSARE